MIVAKGYENFVKEIDAIDNGVKIADGELRYTVRDDYGHNSFLSG